MGVSTALCVVLLCGVLVSTLGDQHSLYYIYTALSKDLTLPGIYEFTALGLLDDREIDYYNSKDQMKVPKQHWMKEKMQEDYWEKGTQSRKSKEQWFKVNVDILMERMRHNKTDLHVLQWRHGCEIDDTTGEVKFMKGIDEYSYDGSEFLSFDDENMRWIAPVQAAEPTKRKWDEVAILNQYTKGYLEKECVDWLTKFMDYGKEELRKHSKPDVYAFAKKSTTNSGKLTLTCLATGFYPKDVKLCVRKFKTSLPEHLLTSSGVRPNEDGTFQLRKSVDIQESDTAQYDCYVTHVTLSEPVIINWEKEIGGNGGVIAAVVAVLLILVGVALVIFILMKKKIIGVPSGPGSDSPPRYIDGKGTSSTNSSDENVNEHSLYYIYTALSKDLQLPGIYEFTALGLLDDREIDYYNSKEQMKVPKQHWMKEKMQGDYWEKGTQSRKSKEQWFKVNVDILMERMRHNKTDLHVLQWRHGCEIDDSNGQVMFLKGIDEYSYDGSEFLSFDDENMRWIAPVPAAEPTKRKWDEVAILNQYTKGYLEKECVDWLTKFMDYGKEELRKHSKPDVYAFAKKSTTNSGKLTLTCMATGFYPKDVKLHVRKFKTSLPEHLVASSGVRPNEDGTYQLRKSVDIQADEKAEYDCFVTHITLSEPVITKW
ncbi:hypothetical protein NFI96_030616, partial [Prochilodus magdalenae]